MKANQERFEECYARANDVLPGAVAAARLPNGSYGHPAISRAWFWYQEGSRDADDNLAEALASTRVELADARAARPEWDLQA